MGDQRSVDGLPCDRRGGVGQSPGARKFAGTQSGLCSRRAAGASRRAGNSSRTKFGICTGTMPPPASPAVPPLAAAPHLAAALAPPATAPGAQIWECRTNGQRTFSDKPCGDKPVLREVSALNIMNPTPILPPRSYEPEPSYAPEYSYPEAQEPAEAAYPVMVGYPVYVGYPYNHRRRPDHAHRPYPHPHAATPRKIQ